MDPSTVHLQVNQDDYYTGAPCECWYDEETQQSKITTNPPFFTTFIPPNVGGQDRPLLYGFVIHVEPHRRYVDNHRFYIRDRDRLLRFGEVLQQHRARCTFQLQPPFTQIAVDIDDDFARQLEGMGHDIGLHCHGGELPPDPTTQDWTDLFREQKALTLQLIDRPIRCWSGGNEFEHITQAAAAAGLFVQTNNKIPSTQGTDPIFLTTSPWRPAGTFPPEAGIYDPDSPRIYVPIGLQPAHCIKVGVVPRPFTRVSFDRLTQNLRKSLMTCRHGYINTGYATLHPGDFGRDETLVTVDQEFAIWDQWLEEVLQPAVDRGQIEPTCPAKMGRIFSQWEVDHGLR